MRKLIRTDGTETDLPEPQSIDQVRKLINADSLDTVNLRHMGRPLHVMFVDDHGHITSPVESIGPNGINQLELRSIGHRKPVNEKATQLYLANCVPGTTHQIVGNVVIVPDDDFAGPNGF